MRAHLSQLCRHSAATALILAASLSAAPALAQTMGGLQSARPLPPPQLAPAQLMPPPRVPAPGAAPVTSSGSGVQQPAPAAVPPARQLQQRTIRDLDAAAPQNIRPPCDCPPPRHPTLEPTAVVMFRAVQPPPAPLAKPPAATAALAAEPVAVLPDPQPAPPLSLQPSPLPAWPPLPPAQPGEGPVMMAQPGAPLLGDATIRTLGPPREPRGPFTRIWQDSQRLVVRDAPEALANALPWVDRDRKDEPLDVVLGRVAGELSRADAADPEWALGAERELRALDARLQRLPEPPPAQPVVMVPPDPVPGGPDARPFQPRPVWPGAGITSEPQRRPTALGTGTEQLDGPTAAGRGSGWAPPADLAPPASPPPPPPPAARTRRSGS